MKIAITGANGYIGSKVVKNLLDMGNEVVAIDRFSDHIDKRATFLNIDIFESDDNYNLFGRPDVCLHLAWRDGFVHNAPSHLEDLPKHIKFTKDLIDAGIKQLAVMGSMHEAGYYEGMISDLHNPTPLSDYGKAKNTLRETLLEYTKNKDVSFQWLRGYYIYGDDLFGNSIFYKIRKACAEGKETFPFNSGKNQYDFLPIEKLVKFISYAVLQDKITGEINICSGKPQELGQVVEGYIKDNNLPIKLNYGEFPDRPYDSKCIYGDNSKINKIVDFFEQRILITGGKGQLGTACLKQFVGEGYKYVEAIDVDELDITKEDDVNRYIDDYKPTVIVHCAAWTNVDKAETNIDLVYKINALGSKYLAEAANRINAKIVYISTDYVFDGKGEKPFEVNDPTVGLSVYGQSKLAGENYVRSSTKNFFIIRISWAFGEGDNNFVKTMLRLANNGYKQLNVVCDQIGSVTYMNDLAALISQMVKTNRFGIYHATNEGYISWADFAQEIFKVAGYNDVTVNRVTSEEYKKLNPQSANRPKNSRLSKKCLDDNGFNRLPDWKDALRRYLGK